ncbi:MAG: hypothetical protein QOF76_2531, partial [Solirubrobacteraceae bacterium]|nr:hypothetical protein [Solirubrobacteraceae bacterium]
TGLPVRPTSGGWLVLPDPVRDELAGRTPLPVAAGRAAGRHYALAAELRAAVTLLAGDPAGLAELLGEQRWPTLADLELGELGVLLAALPDDALADHPAALLSVARLAELSADMELRHGLLERALRLIAPGSALRREAEAEMALHEAIIEPGGAGGAATARALLGDLPPTEYVARIRALFAVAWIDAWRGDPPSMRRAEVALEEAAALCRLAREPEWEATALLGLGYRVCFARGDVDRGIDHMTRALALIPGTGHERASVSAFLATAQMYIGRFDEAESVLHEAEGIARTIGDHRAHAYVAWAWTVLSAMRGDRAATLQRIRSTERRFGPWYDHPTGSEFLTDAAVALTRVGDEQLAWEYAERAREHAAGQGYPEIALLATGAWHARFGDPAQAERDLTAYAASDQPRERDAWHLLLLRSHAAGRSGDAQAAAALAAEAHAAADALGYPQLPQLHEPDLVSAASVPAELGFAVRILGPFAVSAGGRAVVPPPGRPATLVKLLAASGPVALDAAVETLWPGTEAVTGRARLRNLLNRLRAACGDLVQRTDDGLRLAPGARIDAARFEAAAVAALAAPAMTRAGLARAALAGYGGELLPEDRYADWATAPRERLRRRQLELLDLLADDAVERGDVDEAIRLLERATEAEPLDEDRRLRAAELLLFQGRRGSAKTLVERAVAQRGELGIVPDRRLARLADAVGIGPLDARWTAGDQAPPHGHHLRAPAPGREPH